MASVAAKEGGGLERTLRLKPKDRFVVTWEKHESLIRPASPTFELGKCLDQLRSAFPGFGNGIDWSRTSIPEAPSSEEALFWIFAYEICQDSRPSDQEVRGLVGKVTEEFETAIELEFLSGVTAQDLLKSLGHPWRAPENLFCCVAALLDIDNLADFIRAYPAGADAAPAFRQHVAPYLAIDERELIRQRISGTAIPRKFSGSSYDIPSRYHMGALVGCHDEMAAILGQMRDGKLGREGIHCSAAWIVFGLRDRESVIAEARRLALQLNSPEAVRAWLALTEFDALDIVADSVCLPTNKADATKLARPIDCVIAPEMAVPALQIATHSKAAQVGHQWLIEHPVETLVGLAPIVADSGALGRAARDRLDLAEELVDKALPHVAPDVADWLRREVAKADGTEFEEMPVEELHESLNEAFRSVKKSALPKWLTSMPRIEIGKKVLAESETTALIATLKMTAITGHCRLLEALKTHATPSSLDDFAWLVFEEWLHAGAPPKDKWALGAIGHLGGEECVQKLTPLIRQWPGEGQHKRAVFGLECLRRIGSECAMMALNGIALKVKFRALKSKAQAMMEEIADDLGMTQGELADRIVPDCGLDERGTRVFDLGSRQFQFCLGADAKPMLRDAAGKLRPNLPKPNKSDDPDKAEAASDEWKLLKKTLRETLQTQADRLEDAMVSGRRWEPGDFDKFMVRHPLMINLARGLVFAVYDGDGEITQTFRVTEDQALADQKDASLALHCPGSIGIVHPLDLKDASRAAWGEILSDYAIIPPFQQLGRSIFYPRADELEQTEITRYKELPILAVTLYGSLERSPWVRGSAGDGGGYSDHCRRFPAHKTTAIFTYDGIAPGTGNFDETREIKSIYFVRDPPEQQQASGSRLKIQDVDPIILSETLLLADAIVSKAVP